MITFTPMNKRSNLIRVLSAVLPPILFGLAPAASAQSAGEPKWFKGNTHTHTWWSDGDSPPETVVAWYKEHGYQFLVLSDHNILSEGEKWYEPKTGKPSCIEAAAIYEKTYGPDWIQKREHGGKTEYRLKTLTELKSRFEVPGRFLLVQGEEITDHFEKKPIHLNGINLKELVRPQKGNSLIETMQNNIDAVLAQRERTGQPMFPHLNHPNFGYAVTAEDIMVLKGEKFFEIFNGHPGCHDKGDDEHLSTERMWDIVLTKRLAELHLPVMYGLATDDAHVYTAVDSGKPNPGRGWSMVRARSLAPNDIVIAMDAGDFYATTGVLLDRIRFENDTLEIDIRPRLGVSYVTQFIGTRVGYDPSVADRHEDPKGYMLRKYSSDIGKVLAKQSGEHVKYVMTGQEIYVRAKIISTAKHPNPYAAGEVEVAWVQPVQPKSQQKIGR